MSPRTAGLLAMIGASVAWGASPLFFHALNRVPPGELIAHRIVWSLVLFAAILAVQGRLPVLLAALRSRQVLRIVAGAVMIFVNWFLFIWSVQTGHVVQSSLGYYIFPLAAVLTGVVAFGEKLRTPQKVAVGLATLAVALLTWGLGVAPWVSLGIAATFAVYGAVKKRLPLDGVTSVAGEVAVLVPFALAWIALAPEATSPVFGERGWETALLVASGAMTALPLMLFSYAAQRIDLGLVGLLQYINPTMQFLVAVLVLREGVTVWHAVALALIWTGLGIMSAAALAPGRRRGL